jgi:hypothetical protein
VANLTDKSIFKSAVYKKFDVYEFRHGGTILQHDFPKEFGELNDLLADFHINYSDIEAAGGRKSPIAVKFDAQLYDQGWEEKKWDIQVTIDGKSSDSPTHQVDYYRNNVAVELEWNNKDPFYDRDLNNFRLLHELGVISVGIIVTRTTELQELFVELGKGKSYGASTTHVGKLLPKINGGGAAECPLLVFGIRKEACTPDAIKAEAEKEASGADVTTEK